MRHGHRLSIASMALVVGALTVLSGSALAAPAKLNKPVLTCGASTQSSITLHVCGDATTGAPAGVSIQWKKYSDWLVDGWDATTSYCELSLSGVPGGSRWSLGPGGCQDITIDGLPKSGADEIGASSACNTGLACGTEYIFRAFAHAVPGGLNKSDFTCSGSSETGCVKCSTAPCVTSGCTFTWGYWKTHGPDVVGCSPGNQENDWNVNSLKIGNVIYNEAQLCAILHDNPGACAKGGTDNGGANAVVILEHQLIAAMLNQAEGNVSCAFADAAIIDANALLVGYEGACVGASTLLGQQMLAVKDVLAQYNNDICGCPVPNKPQAVPGSATPTKPSSWGKVKTIYR